MANLFQPSIARATDSNGASIPGAKMYFYLTGTTTLASVFTDQAGSIASSNPVIADSSGLFDPIYINKDSTYRVILKNADDSATIYDVDPVRGFDESTAANQTAADAVATAADAVATAADRVQTASDRVQTGLDRVATAADVLSTAADVVSSAAIVADASAALAAGTVSSLVGTRIYASRAALNADLVPADALYALVLGDATAANNDLYIKNGATTAGDWTGPLGFFAAASAEASAFADAAAASTASIIESFEAYIADDTVITSGGYYLGLASPNSVALTAFYARILSGSGTADVTITDDGVTIFGPVTISGTTSTVISVPVAAGSDLAANISNLTGTITGLVARVSGTIS